MRPGGRDRREGEILELARFAAKGFERLRGIDLGELALRRFGVEPVQEAHDRSAVAQMRGA